jgi:hypothetical protein
MPIYDSFDDFRTAFESDNTIDRANPLKGTPMGTTIDALFEVAETAIETSVTTSNRSEVAAPTGAGITVASLQTLTEVINTLGASAIVELQHHKDHDAVTIEYHFD